MSEERFALNLMSKLFLNSGFSDVTVVVNGEQIPAHKTILAASCDYFKSICCQSNEKPIKIELDLEAIHATSHHLKLMLKYIYTGFVDMDAMIINDVIALYSLTNLLKFSPLEKIALKKLLEIEPSVEIVGKLFKTGVCNESIDLRHKCLSFLDSMAQVVVAEKEEFAKLPLALILELSSRDTFEAPEIEIFKAILYWKENNKCHDLNEVFTNIRLNLITGEDFAMVVFPTKLFSSEDYFGSFRNAKKERRRNSTDLAVACESSQQCTSTSNSQNDNNSHSETSGSMDSMNMHDPVKLYFIESTWKMFAASVDEMVGEGSLSKECYDEMHSLTDLITTMLREESSESIENLRNAIRFKTAMKTRAAQLGAIEVVMQIISQKRMDRSVDDVMCESWFLLVTLTEEVPSNCKSLVSDTVVQCFEECLEQLFKGREILTSAVLHVIKNISDCDDLKYRVMRPKIVEACLALTPGVSVTLDYLCRHILAQFCSLNVQIWIKYLPNVNRSDALVRLMPSVKELRSTSLPKIGYSTFATIFKTIHGSKSVEPKHWAIWTMAHLTFHDPKQYCPFVTNLQSVYPRNFTCIPEVEELCSILLKNVKQWQKHKPVRSFH